MSGEQCPWCKAAPAGHECAERDHWLEIEDSEMGA